MAEPPAAEPPNNGPPTTAAATDSAAPRPDLPTIEPVAANRLREPAASPSWDDAPAVKVPADTASANRAGTPPQPAVPVPDVPDPVPQIQVIPTPTVASQPIPPQADPTQPAADQKTADPATSRTPIVTVAKADLATVVSVSPVKPNRRGNETDPPPTDTLSLPAPDPTVTPALAVATNTGTHAMPPPQPDPTRSEANNTQPVSDVSALTAALAGEQTKQAQSGSASPDDQHHAPAGETDTIAEAGNVARPQPPAVAAVHTDLPPSAPAGSAGEQIAVHVAKALQDGSKTITVELHPAELGRVEIRLSFQADGLSVRMTVDRQETFDAFSRDRTGLEQQLGQAGVDLGAGGLDLRLGQQSDPSKSDTNGGGSRTVSAAPAPVVPSTTLWVGHGWLDILA